MTMKKEVSKETFGIWLIVIAVLFLVSIPAIAMLKTEKIWFSFEREQVQMNPPAQCTCDGTLPGETKFCCKPKDDKFFPCWYRKIGGGQDWGQSGPVCAGEGDKCIEKCGNDPNDGTIKLKCCLCKDFYSGWPQDGSCCASYCEKSCDQYPSCKTKKIDTLG